MVSVITCTIRDEMIENVFDNYSSQLWKKKELIIILNKDSISIEKWKKKALDYENVSIIQLPEEKTLGECLNYGIEKSKYDFIAKFDDDDYYSPYYLTEAMDAFKNNHVHLVGKGSSYMYLPQEKLLFLRKIGNEDKLGRSSLKGGTLVFKKEIYPKVKFQPRKAGTDAVFINDCIKKKYKIYATSKYNYVYIRREEQSHTYKINNDSIKKNSKFIGKTDDFKEISTKEFGIN
ncbi:glycosyltransferase [Neobacillus kokaensis]|uniref:Glycosyl transferase n=1 Tax=Neobacillus kokaensis TaxID=2759023 RepID=A0ABQ3N3R8_9BACI|nr:glycosyltransferase [Neobacillus kokaensis]GHH99569.1 glycosyl transferase [Neobacillus kokaensis]